MGLRDDWHRLIHLRRFNTAEEFPEFNAKTVSVGAGVDGAAGRRIA